MIANPQQHIYRVRSVEDVIDGDTYLLAISQGFYTYSVQHVRLLGWDCPETNAKSEREREAARDATMRALTWFISAAKLKIWLRSEKADSFGRWLGEVWATTEEGEPVSDLGEHLAASDLAVVWPHRWHQVYDPR